MCDFVSWIESDGEIYFMSNKTLATKKGKELSKELHEDNVFHDEISGHSIIGDYFNLNKGIAREKVTLSNTHFLPKVIIQAIKNMEMTRIGYSEGMLTSEAAQMFYNKCDYLNGKDVEKEEKKLFWKIFRDPYNRRACWR